MDRLDRARKRMDRSSGTTRTLFDRLARPQRQAKFMSDGDGFGRAEASSDLPPSPSKHSSSQGRTNV